MADYFSQKPSKNSQITVKDEAPMSYEELKLITQLEQDIFDRLQTNFLFSEGKKLQDGLIDPLKTFALVNKIKELAT